jgi:hypothetical protein
MKIQKVKGKNGKLIEFHIPENDEDIKKLREMEKKNQLSYNASFGDWKQKELSDFSKDST